MITDNLNKTDWIVNQLVKIYFLHENWHANRLTFKSAYRYHYHMIEQEIINVYEEEGCVLGYYECFRINQDQLDKIINKKPFYNLDENLVDGPIAYVANIYIKEDCRRGKVYKELKKMFFKQHHTADVFCGNALRKKTQPFKFFQKDRLKSSLFLTGE